MMGVFHSVAIHARAALARVPSAALPVEQARRVDRDRRRLIIVALIARSVVGVLCLMPFMAFGQKLAWEEYDRLLESRRAVTALSADNAFGDSLDLYSGVLSFSATDVSIPGNSKLPVSVTRKFTVTNREQYGGYAYSFADWELDIPRLSGVFAPAWHDNRCDVATPPNPTSGVPVDEVWSGNHADMPGGGEMLLVASTWPKPSAGGPYKWVTAGNTYFSCLPTINNGTGQGFLAVTSDGTKYWFNHMARIPEPGFQYQNGYDHFPYTSRFKVYLYATRVEDRFGNSVTYSYSNTATQPVKITQITSNEEPLEERRTITFRYNDASGFVSEVSDGTQTWFYGYQGDSLSTVTLPDTSSWQISFASLSDARIQPLSDPNDGRRCYTPEPFVLTDYTGSITHPSGAKGTYTVSPVRFGRTNVPAICRNYQRPGVNDPNGTRDDYFYLPVRAAALALTRRQISGPALTTGTWTYAWSGGLGSWQYPPGETEPVCQETNCLDPVCLSDDCAGSRGLTITEPGGRWTKHIYGNSYRYNEGKLLSTQTGVGSTVLRTVAYDYNYATSGQPYSAKIGTNPQRRSAGFVSEYPRPMVARLTTQNAIDFIWVVAKGCTGADIFCFDAFARPTKVLKTSMAAGTTELVPPNGRPVLTVPAMSTTGSYAVTWTPITYASRYELLERLGTAAWSTIHNAAGTSKALSGKANGSWSYQVRACNAQGCTSWSPIGTIEVAVPPSAPPVITAPPTSTSGNYAISWTPSARATRYELEERNGGGPWIVIHNTSSTTQARAAQPAGTYQYRVRACNAGGCSAYSATATTVVNLTTPPPAAPTGLTIHSDGTQGVPFLVSWNGVAGATSYELHRNRNDLGWATVYTGSATSSSQATGPPGTLEYKVRACNANGCGVFSASAFVVISD